MITAKFGSKNFEVTGSKIYTPNGISISDELNLEEKEVSGKKPTVTVKGEKAQSVSFDLKLDERFVDVNEEIKWWKDALKSQGSKKLVIGKDSLGLFFLQKYDLKNIVLKKNGNYSSALLSLSFIEDGGATNSARATEANLRAAENAKKYQEAEQVKKDAEATPTIKVRVGSTIHPKSGVRWYETAEGALKKTGKSGKAYDKDMKVTYKYNKSTKVKGAIQTKIVCVNPQGLGWLKVEDVKVIKY